MRMTWLMWLIAAASTSALIVLWFHEVRRRLREQYSMVESARSQLTAYEKRAAVSVGDTDAAEILHRSHSIYQQAADNYNAALKKPLIGIPGRLMGFYPEPED